MSAFRSHRSIGCCRLVADILPLLRGFVGVELVRRRRQGVGGLLLGGLDVLKARDAGQLAGGWDSIAEPLALQFRGEALGRIDGFLVGQHRIEHCIALALGLQAAIAFDGLADLLQPGLGLLLEHLRLLERLLLGLELHVGLAQLLGLHEILESLLVLGHRLRPVAQRVAGLKGGLRRGLELGRRNFAGLAVKGHAVVGQARRGRGAGRLALPGHGRHVGRITLPRLGLRLLTECPVRTVLHRLDELANLIQQRRTHLRVGVRISRKRPSGQQFIDRLRAELGQIPDGANKLLVFQERAQRFDFFGDGVDRSLSGGGVLCRGVGGSRARGGSPGGGRGCLHGRAGAAGCRRSIREGGVRRERALDASTGTEQGARHRRAAGRVHVLAHGLCAVERLPLAHALNGGLRDFGGHLAANAKGDLLGDVGHEAVGCSPLGTTQQSAQAQHVGHGLNARRGHRRLQGEVFIFRRDRATGAHHFVDVVPVGFAQLHSGVLGIQARSGASCGQRPHASLLRLGGHPGLHQRCGGGLGGLLGEPAGDAGLNLLGQQLLGALHERLLDGPLADHPANKARNRPGRRSCARNNRADSTPCRGPRQAGDGAGDDLAEPVACPVFREVAEAAFALKDVGQRGARVVKLLGFLGAVLVDVEAGLLQILVAGLRAEQRHAGAGRLLHLRQHDAQAAGKGTLLLKLAAAALFLARLATQVAPGLNRWIRHHRDGLLLRRLALAALGERLTNAGKIGHRLRHPRIAPARHRLRLLHAAVVLGDSGVHVAVIALQQILEVGAGRIN